MMRSPFETRYDNKNDRGITWVDGPNTRLYRYEVKFRGAGLLKGTIRAESKRQAIQLANRRWPDAENIEVFNLKP